MKKTVITAAAAAACALASPVSAQLAVHHDLTYPIAKKMAEGAMDACVKNGYHVSVHVVNRFGATIVAYLGDGAAPHTFENSREKAYTAMTFKRPSRAFANEYDSGNFTRAQQADFPGVVALGGGLPIKDGNEVIGGLGVSGAAGGKDDACTQAGIDAVAAMLH